MNGEPCTCGHPRARHAAAPGLEGVGCHDANCLCTDYAALPVEPAKPRRLPCGCAVLVTGPHDVEFVETCEACARSVEVQRQHEQVIAAMTLEERVKALEAFVFGAPRH